MIKSKMLPYSGFVLASFFILLVMVNDASALEQATIEIGPPYWGGDIVIDLIVHDWTENDWKTGTKVTSTTTITQAEILEGMTAVQKAEKIKNQILADFPGLFDIDDSTTPGTLVITSKDANNPEVTCSNLKDLLGEYTRVCMTGIEGPGNEKWKSKAKLTGIVTGGSATFGVNNVSKTVTTDGKTIPQIYSEWQSLFGEGTITADGFELPPRESLTHSFNLQATDPGLTIEVTQVRVFDIPTVSEWGLIIMAGLLLTVGAVAIRRRFKTVPA